MTVKFIWLGLVLFLLNSCNGKKLLFTQLDPGHTNIHFSNRIIENDSVNILDNEYVYNGGGVGIADLNGDNLQDIIFSGNMVPGKLYINKGQLRFEDITEKSMIDFEGRWCSGVSIVDINKDNKPDIYFSTTFHSEAANRTNLLFVNQGNNPGGIPVFKEMSEEYGIADTSYSTNSVFFDYDLDGDLDLYVLNDQMDEARYPNKYHFKITDGKAPGTDKLYRNDWNEQLNHPYFKDVSKEAGILIEGFGLGVHISDINRDGWPDIYVTNDYISNDLLYINNKNGTFINRAADYFKHTSFSAMGNDIADINNDGLQDIIALDMLPKDNYRKKMMLNPNNYSSYLNNSRFNYEYQYVRNTLQLNLGWNLPNDTSGHPVFAEIAWYANIAETDWSWSPLVADFDNDGYKDIIITNGFPRDVTDHDYIAYRDNTKNYAAKATMLDEIPEVKINNYAFHNNGDLTFSDVSEKWGITQPSFSTGAAYADLDNDGDLDYVVNNTNDSAFIFRNNLLETPAFKNNYLRIILDANSKVEIETGAFVELSYGNGNRQIQEATQYRGYLSTIEKTIHFGLGTDSIVREIKITWPDGKKQFISNVRANQVLRIKKNADYMHFPDSARREEAYFKNISQNIGIKFRHPEKDYIDFNVQKLLPHKFSQYGPSIAVGDVNNDSLDDFFVSGSYGNRGIFFIQRPDGSFYQKKLSNEDSGKSKNWDDAGSLLFDADRDGDLDLYISTGGFENIFGSENYRDNFYLNDGRGNFKVDSSGMPKLNGSKSCVKAADYDNDGDLDLFIGGRVIPGFYPKPTQSFILQNNSVEGRIDFKDVTSTLIPEFLQLGLVTDMLWTDYDNDGWVDIMLIGEWMRVTIFKNDKGKFRNVSSTSGLESYKGWWNSLVAGDFDNDGDMDYVAGNLGLNSYYKASPLNPVKIYANDYNRDGAYDAIPTLFLPDALGKKQEFPAFGRDDLIKQMIGFKLRFPTYEKFAHSPIHEILTKDEIANSLILEASEFRSSMIINNGQGKFSIKPLPAYAQFSSIYGMVATDINDDTFLDLIINGNDFGTEISTGRYDSFNGMVLFGDGSFNFRHALSGETGFYVPGDGKGLSMISGAGRKPMLIATQNNDDVLAFSLHTEDKMLFLNSDDKAVVYKYKNGSSRKEEVFYGHSFFSQSGRYIRVGNNLKSVSVFNALGKSREINF